MNPVLSLRLIPLLLLMSVGLSQAQPARDPDLVQFSGVIVTSDSLQTVPFCDIIIRNANRGTTSDYNGYFSFVAKKKDVIVFTAMGFKQSAFTIPDTLTNNRYSLIQALTSDTIFLSESVIYPWPSVEQFKQAFVHLDIPDDDYELARKNLARMEIRERARHVAMDGTMNYRNYIDRQTSKLYYVGQLPPNNLLNPFAWAQFIKMWREGKFKSGQ
ncbi:MAG TPA: carboxypeptidase-like regulatory domain-containing protein [Bacteroidales bacterium]|nr:carboxypeptidase-like regulatory domain-containing protein [Bacteroidales bacterium]HSA43546.1 carboxypeptidase-like regulatory domain-containing protein [Bacteroidales bacterium]